MALLTATTNGVDFSSLIESLTGVFSVADILSLVGTVVAAGGTLFIAWFGAKKITRAVLTAFRSGKIKI